MAHVMIRFALRFDFGLTSSHVDFILVKYCELELPKISSLWRVLCVLELRACRIQSSVVRGFPGPLEKGSCVVLQLIVLVELQTSFQ